MIVTQVSVDNFFARSVGGKTSFSEKRVGNGCIDGGELTWVFRYEKKAHPKVDAPEGVRCIRAD